MALRCGSASVSNGWQGVGLSAAHPMSMFQGAEGQGYAFWVKAPTNASGNDFASLMNEDWGFPWSLGATLKQANNIVHLGRWGNSSNTCTTTSGSVGGTGRWHCIVVRIERTGASQMTIESWTDWVSDGTDTGAWSSPTGQTFTAMQIFQPTGTNLPPVGTLLHRMIGWRGVPSLAEIKGAMIGGIPFPGLTRWVEGDHAGDNMQSRVGYVGNFNRTGSPGLSVEMPPGIAPPQFRPKFSLYLAPEARSVTDGLNLGDSVSSVLGFAQSLSDGISLGDSVIGALSFTASAADGIKLGEDIDTTATYDTGPDGILLGDSVSAVGSIAAAATDGIELGDAPSADGPQIPLLDGVILGDSVAGALGFASAVADGIFLGESVAAASAGSRSVQDGLLLGDAVVESLAFYGAAADGVLLGDAVGVATTFLASATDGLSLGDSISQTLAFVQTVTDGVLLGDSVVPITEIVPAPRNALGPDRNYRYLGED